MWNGKNKAVTFSYDDGVTQDIQLVNLFNKYGLKCTFNLNSGLMNKSGEFEIKGQKNPPNGIRRFIEPIQGTRNSSSHCTSC